jgi:valyl-tRNA synthetase
MSNLETIEMVSESVENALSFRVMADEYFVPLNELINVEDEIVKLKEELLYYQGFMVSVDKKLNNERFVSNAPESVVAIEKKKKEDAQSKISTIEYQLAFLQRSANK